MTEVMNISVCNYEICAVVFSDWFTCLRSCAFHTIRMKVTPITMSSHAINST